MIKQLNNDLVLIEPEKVEEKSEGGIIRSAEEQANIQKKQNRGTIKAIGKDVSWPAVGDFVSFYRNAATEIEEEGQKYFVIHSNHVLCSIG